MLIKIPDTSIYLGGGHKGTFSIVHLEFEDVTNSYIGTVAEYENCDSLHGIYLGLRALSKSIGFNPQYVFSKHFNEITIIAKHLWTVETNAWGKCFNNPLNCEQIPEKAFDVYEGNVCCDPTLSDDWRITHTSFQGVYNDKLARKNGYRIGMIAEEFFYPMDHINAKYNDFYFVDYDSILPKHESDSVNRFVDNRRDHLDVETIRKSNEYRNWRIRVLKRDNKCTICGYDGEKLEVHHLFGVAEHPEIATDVGNGVTMCKWCHGKYHSMYGVKDINPNDFMNFKDKFGM